MEHPLTVQLEETWSALGKAASAAYAGVDQARARMTESAKTAMEQQIAAAAAFAKVKSPQEFLELQSRLSREAFVAYTANVKAMTDLWTSSLNATFKPIRDLSGTAK